MKIIGIDLSGPGSPEHTAVAVCQATRESLRVESIACGATDEEVAALVPRSSAVVGIDSPLSYSATGGDRLGDSRARAAGIAAGLRSGSVMAPTAPRMVYLTLRGIGLSRLLEAERPRCRIVEVHPTLTFALRGTPLRSTKNFKSKARARRFLLDWLERQGFATIPDPASRSDHEVAALAGALAAWHWYRKTAVWIHEAAPPLHPYDFAC